MQAALRLTVAVTAAVCALAAAGATTAGARSFPVTAIQDTLQAKGSVSSGVLQVGVDRNDIDGVTVHGVPIKPAFEIDGELDFQPRAHGRAVFNGDLPVKADEINPVIDAITANGLTFQAEHQHLYDFDPMVWFIHFRGTGDPLALARRVHAVLKATATPLPQAPPSKPTTPLDEHRLQRILHGSDAEVGADGVVTVTVPRRDKITLAGVHVKPETNVATTVAFEPLNDTAAQAAAVPDFALEAREVDPVVRLMRARGWDIGCLYNQETAERPQLYFSHQLKTGDPYVLAADIRRGLDRMNSR
jgi:hypothetical protein